MGCNQELINAAHTVGYVDALSDVLQSIKALPDDASKTDIVRTLLSVLDAKDMAEKAGRPQ